MANTFKKVIDQLVWRQVNPSPNAHTAAASMASDLRSTLLRNPFAYNLISNTVLNRFNIITKAWQPMASPALAGTFGAGSTCAFGPPKSYRSTASFHPCQAIRLTRRVRSRQRWLARSR